MSELNDHPDSVEPDAVELDAVELDGVEPHDAPWPDDAAPTGDAAVDSALGRLAGVSAVPVAEHSGIYAEIHDSLMASLDEER
ncbi:hypothetical protein [Arthrobacter bambusae]|uniref:Uncharacterized protein n=1 Tax=Arthrobacter bambusae TaxID=1338426 RepID=A0AAW8DLW3_9MICC|nr:hypothetical protein [Arthrobacter bambusae]MDP9907049.1 hypothetical protein [Arthrobacter bambusae]MDQ0131938.1 hypothetical protein [Arthrobacter bambusae]MDQ0183339.1 hypothetical protein [Arthrobacter bambusae]